MVVPHAFTPKNGKTEAEAGADICEFEASLVYRASSRINRVIQRNPVLTLLTLHGRTYPL